MLLYFINRWCQKMFQYLFVYSSEDVEIIVDVSSFKTKINSVLIIEQKLTNKQISNTFICDNNKLR